MINRQEQRQILRQSLKRTRQSLSASQCLDASAAVCAKILSLAIFQQSQHIAYYFAQNNEIDLIAVWQQAHVMNKKNYFPTLDDALSSMLFLPYKPTQPLKSNRYGISEPLGSSIEAIAPSLLELVFVPLVGFDLAGNRLGMGAGYYDRTFDFLCNKQIKKPLLIGVGYELQKVEGIPTEVWDVKLDGVVTEKAYYLF